MYGLCDGGAFLRRRWRNVCHCPARRVILWTACSKMLCAAVTVMPHGTVFQVNEDVCKTLQATKTMLYGTTEQEPQAEHVSQLAMEMYQHNLLLLLIRHLSKIEFEVGELVVCVLSQHCCLPVSDQCLL